MDNAVTNSVRADRELQRPRELAVTLARLRGLAVLAQIATLLLVAEWLALPVPIETLAAGTAVLAAFALIIAWRLRTRAIIGGWEVVGHLAVDIGVLCYLLYFSGGATNPFVTLFIMPVALAATALSARHVAVVLALCAAAYALLMFRYQPLPAIHDHDASSQFNLHVAGMGINFAISATLLGYFIWRLARALRERESIARRERERALRDEGILAIATQAAGAAHELNTPLSTIRTLLGELRREHRHPDLDEDLTLLAEQAERCAAILRELVGAAQLDADAPAISVRHLADTCVDRFRLFRPEIDLRVEVTPAAANRQLVAAHGLQHSLIALLNNAADASTSRKSTHVDFSVVEADDNVEFVIRDHGGGIPADISGQRFASTKPDGLGLGLALAHATSDRIDGELRVEKPGDGGTRIRLRVPARSADNSVHDR